MALVQMWQRFRILIHGFLPHMAAQALLLPFTVLVHLNDVASSVARRKKKHIGEGGLMALSQPKIRATKCSRTWVAVVSVLMLEGSIPVAQMMTATRFTKMCIVLLPT